MSSHELPQQPLVGSAERWKNQSKLSKYGGAVVALVKAVAGHPEMDDQRDADRRAAFYADLQQDMAQRNAARVVNEQGLVEMPDPHPRDQA